MQKQFKLMEYLWLTLALFCFIFAIYVTFVKNFKESYIFFIFTAICVIMYFLRKKMRQKFENQDN